MVIDRDAGISNSRHELTIKVSRETTLSLGFSWRKSMCVL